MRNHDYLRNAVTLGTGLTALFLFVRCSIPERDYSKLGIGQNAGSGGASGSAGDGSTGDVAGAAGLGDPDHLDGTGGTDALTDAGGRGGAPPVAPVACVALSLDAGSDDAGASDAGGSDDAGISDAGTNDAACECVNGFYRAVDADGDGERSRACRFAPGTDCDDNDPAVTHNGCGGCSVLPNAIGEDCGDCGTYACDGPDAVICVSKPGPVEDPDCRCQNGLIVAKDVDGDGAGTKLCEQNPGTDCNDGDPNFITDACGGCNESPPGALGAACNQCGVYTCSGTAIVCGPNPSAGGKCTDARNRQTCNSNGFWGNDALCPNVCYQGNCEVCTPGTYQCIFYTTGDAIQLCYDSSSYGILWISDASCSGATLRCDPTNGTCHSSLVLPRDESFEVAPPQRGLPWHDLLNTARDSDYG
ncbi:MAG TPA: hypothetical protein VG963_19580 [Polyangiaceae bacterium]|nr:hypothetical protein [Polyangiaceae bacterium]